MNAMWNDYSQDDDIGGGVGSGGNSKSLHVGLSSHHRTKSLMKVKTIPRDPSSHLPLENTDMPNAMEVSGSHAPHPQFP
jgi:hypothetical protein